MDRRHRYRVGDLWNDLIDEGLRKADGALLLISTSFLSSKFIREHELPRLLKRRNEGMRVMPVLIGACPWKQIAWLEQAQLRPEGGVPPGRGEGPKTPKGATIASAVVGEMTCLLKEAPTNAPRPANLSPYGDAAADLIVGVLLKSQDVETGSRSPSSWSIASRRSQASRDRRC